jgi:glycine betaine/proline transport system ATP-binding protein
MWFLDEPITAQEPLNRLHMQDEFLRLQRKLGKTIVFITHDMQEAFRLADRIAIMRQGEIIQIGRPADIVREPADDYVARFVEDIPLVRVMLAKDIMRPVNGAGSAAADTVEPTTTVEELLARLAGGASGFRVADSGGALGAIDAAAVLSIVDRDRQRRR